MNQEEMNQQDPVIEQSNGAPPSQEMPDQSEAQAQSDQKEQNWRAVREAKERAERERDEAYRLLREVEQTRMQQPQQAPVPDDNFQDDDLIEGRHLKKLKQEIEQYKQQLTYNTTEARIKAQFPDFDEVVTDVSMRILSEKDPYISRSIQADPDLYNKAVVAYRTIKNMGIYQQDNYQQQKATVNNNAQKPRPASSVSPTETPLSQANAWGTRMSKDQKKQLFEEMKKYARSI